MKTLQKSLLRGIITILTIDLLIQLINHDSLTTLIKINTGDNSIAFWTFPIAFILGSLIAGLLLYYYSHFFLISFGIFLIGVIHGGYGLISSVRSYIYLRFVHGFLVASNLTVAFSWYSHLIEKEKLRNQVGRLLLPIPYLGFLFMSVYRVYYPNVGFHWSIFTFIFFYLFLSILSLFLMNYLNEISEGTMKLTIKDLKAIITSGLINYSLASMISAFTLGTLFQTFFRFSPMELGVLFFSIALVFMTKFRTIGNLIGDTKSLLMAFLIMAFSLSLLPILYQNNLLLIPMILLGISIGILGSCIYGGVKESFNYSNIGLIIGFLHSISILSYIGGWRIANMTLHGSYSPYLINSLIIIGISTLYLRKIHQTAKPPINL